MSALKRRRLFGSRIARAGSTLAALVGLGLVGWVLLGGATSSAATGSANLSITKSDSPDPVRVGGSLGYTLKVANAGPDTTTGVVATDKLPKGVAFVSASSSRGSCGLSKLTVTCNLGTLGTDTYSGAAEATIRVKAPSTAGKITDTASVDGDQKDPKRANNKDSETTTVVGGPPPPQCRNRPATIIGTAGNDVLNGTPNADVVVARGGADRVATFGGRDLICAGAGADIVSAGSRADQVRGGGGGDRLRGQGGNDTLRGQHGRDRLRGGRGADLLAGGPGDDRCKGGPGHDTLRSC